MKLVLISTPDFFDEEIALLSCFFDEGLQYFHLRKNNCQEEDIRKFLGTLPKQYHNKIILHSHFSLVPEYGLKGIHFSSRTKSLIPDYENYCFHKSISTHSMEEVESIQHVGYDYVFLSPVFNSISKADYKSGIDTKVFKEWKQNYHFPFDLIALGGIEKNNIQKTRQYGFEGVALLGAVWIPYFQEKSIDAACKRCKELLSSVRDIS
jgi:thiamine-phosphate pyrophosphorylase